jgi:cysteinyl-tRNA synthetase
MLLMNGKKMSKSDGNTISPQELFEGNSVHVTKGYSPMVVRFFMLQSHYRSPNDLTDEALLAAEKGWKRLMEAYKNLQELQSPTQQPAPLDERVAGILDQVFFDMDDDFNTPRALAGLFELVTLINSLKEKQLPIEEISSQILDRLKSNLKSVIFDIFGLIDEAGQQAGPVDPLMQLIIELRHQAREQKDWPTSDKIRDSLTQANIIIKDGKEGTTWSYK